MRPTAKIFSAGLATMLVGCMTTPTKPDPAYAAARPAAPPPATLNHGAIYQDGFAVSLFEDARARRVGDVLTVVLTESTMASKEAKTATAKENQVALMNPTLFGSAAKASVHGTYAGWLPLQSKTGNTWEMNTDTSQKFDGSGSSSQSNSLSGKITVTVADVLANGNLVVRGEKILALNDGDEFVRLSGIIRPQDIRPGNTVLSTSIANAQITYGGNGALADANSQGWLSRFFLKFWPF